MNHDEVSKLEKGQYIEQKISVSPEIWRIHTVIGVNWPDIQIMNNRTGDVRDMVATELLNSDWRLHTGLYERVETDCSKYIAGPNHYCKICLRHKSAHSKKRRG